MPQPPRTELDSALANLIEQAEAIRQAVARCSATGTPAASDCHPADDENLDGWLSTAQAARVLGWSVKDVRAAVYLDQLPAKKRRGRHLIHPDALVEFHTDMQRRRLIDRIQRMRATAGR